MPSRVAAVLLSTHPGPTVTVTVITVGLGIGMRLEGSTLALLGLVIVLDQASVGLSNDWIDAERDRQTARQDKPIARGWISVRAIRRAAFITATASVVLSVPLGPMAVIAHFVVLGFAWAYNVGLKNSIFSVVPYIVTFGMLPVFAAAVIPHLAAWWVIVAGSVLGVAAHFANVLPDLDDDSATGVRGLPHRLGYRWAGVTTFVSLAIATVVVVAGAELTTTALGIAGLGIGAIVATTGIVLVATRPPSRALFRLIILQALVAAGLLLASGVELTA